jgi:hypothetical protein
VGHESVDELDGNIAQRVTDYHPIYLGNLSVDPESYRLSSNIPRLSLCLPGE